MIKQNRGENKTTHDHIPKLHVSIQTSLLAEKRERTFNLISHDTDMWDCFNQSFVHLLCDFIHFRACRGGKDVVGW